MGNLFEIIDINSGVKYIQMNAPDIYEKMQLEFKEIDVCEKEFIADYKKEKIVQKEIFNTFELSGADAVILTEVNGKLAIKNFLTNQTCVVVDGKYKFIGDMCFSFCRFIEKLVFKEGVKHIGDRVLYNSQTVKEVVFPKSLNFLGDESFKKCSNLENVIFLNPRMWITPQAFEGTKWYDEFTDEFVIINGQLLKYNGNADKVIIPEGTINIARYVFYGNKTVESVICPSTLEGIWTYSFANCENLKEVVFNENLTMINIGAFSGCSNLNEVVLPRGLTKIGLEAFDIKTTVVIYNEKKSFVKYIKEHYPKHRVID